MKHDDESRNWTSDIPKEKNVSAVFNFNSDFLIFSSHLFADIQLFYAAIFLH